MRSATAFVMWGVDGIQIVVADGCQEGGIRAGICSAGEGEYMGEQR